MFEGLQHLLELEHSLRDTETHRGPLGRIRQFQLLFRPSGTLTGLSYFLIVCLNVLIAFTNVYPKKIIMTQRR